MLNTPEMFCRLCSAANADALEFCPVCGTSNMERRYTVTITFSLDVTEYGEPEAVQRAITELQLDPYAFIDKVSTISQDLDGDITF